MLAKGLYIVSEEGCLTPNSGANKHINIGINELRKYFDVDVFFLFNSIKDNRTNQSTNNKNAVNLPAGYLKGTLKDLYVFYKNHRYFFKYYKKVKELKPQFIYERAAYFNFTGLMIAKLLKIPHFYEVNGYFSNDVKVYYKSVINSTVHKCILFSYKKSNASFYVGLYKSYLNINHDNAYSVENGVEQNIITKNQSLQKKRNNNIKIVFVGHAMPHHGLDALCSAINMMKCNQNFEFTFIGRDTEKIKNLITTDVKVTFLGPKLENEIYDLIQQYDIGIIPASSEYASSMKLFLYGAVKLCVMVPNTKYFSATFSPNEVLFFENHNAKSLAFTLDNLIVNRTDYTVYGENLFSTIKEKYTWEKIFEFKISIIRNYLK